MILDVDRPPRTPIQTRNAHIARVVCWLVILAALIATVAHLLGGAA